MFRKEIYTFDEVATSTITRFTSSSTDVVQYVSNSAYVTYGAAAIGRSAIDITNEINTSEIEISIDVTNPLAVKWMGAVIDQTVLLTIQVATSLTPIKSIKFKDADVSVETVWKGRLTMSSISDNIVTLTFESNYSKLKRAGARRVYSRLCPYILYGSGCNLKKENFADASVKVISYSGNVCSLDLSTMTHLDENYFTGGMVSSNSSFSYILRQKGNRILLNRIPTDIKTDIDQNGSAIVTLYAGCDRSTKTCKNKFNNLNNHGGFPYMATRNLFTHSLL